MDQARTTDTVGAFLEHHGVKGMHWGVRKNPDKAARKTAKQDLAFEKASRNPHAHLNLWAQSVKELKKSGDLAAINNRPEFAKAKFRLKAGVAKRPLQEKYDDVVAGAVLTRLKGNAKQIVNRSGTRSFDIDTATRASKNSSGAKVLRASKTQWRIVTVDIQQADDGSMLIEVVRDEVGRIIDLIPENVSLEQSDLVGPFLEHYGVKGMHWGQRMKDRKARKSATSTDAKASLTVRAKAKSHTPKALSNAQLTTAINRMNLEQNYKRLAVNEKSGVTRWVSSMMLEIGKKEVQAAVARKVAAGIAKTAVGA
jgi:hypothetical protein